MTRPRAPLLPQAGRSPTAVALAGRDWRDLDVDRAVPALLLKVGQYPIHSGGLGVIRTLGRLGIAVYAITEPGLTPAGASRYCTDTFVWRATGHEEPGELVADLRKVGDRIGARAVVVPVDDEAAVLVAEHRGELADQFLSPSVRAELPRKLASKPGLYELCVEHGFPSPASVGPRSMADVAAFAATASYPVVVKNAEVWERRQRPVVPGTTIVQSKSDLLELIGSAAARQPPGDRSPGVLLQEYLPPEHSEDWIVHLYCDAESRCRVLFTGLKTRSWPPKAGVTACAYSIGNPPLAMLAARFCTSIGFAGVADLDVRLDLRDGQYKLVDFNPRAGNQFRLFESLAGVDVVRALHLDLTGRPIPDAPQVEARRIIVEHADLPARFAYRRMARRSKPGLVQHPVHTSTEYAWLSTDDPFPALVMIRHAAGSAARQVRHRLSTRLGGLLSQRLG